MLKKYIASIAALVALAASILRAQNGAYPQGASTGGGTPASQTVSLTPAATVTTATGSDWCAAIAAADTALGSSAGKIIVPSTLAGTCASALTLAYNGLSATRIIEFGTGAFTGSIATLPNDGTARQAPIRLYGQTSSHSSLSPGGSSGGTFLNLTNNAAVAKIDTRGGGTLEIDHFNIEDTASDCATFVFTANTILKIHDNVFIGTAAQPSACNDGIVLGGTGTTNGLLATSAFSGYGTVIENNTFSQMKRIAVLQTFSNNIQIVDNTVGADCGGSGGAIELIGADATHSSTGNYIAGNLIEVTGYKYAFNLTNAANNDFISNGMWDAASSFVAYYNFNAGAVQNTFMSSMDGGTVSSAVGPAPLALGDNSVNNNFLSPTNGWQVAQQGSVGGVMSAASYSSVSPEISSGTPVVTGLGSTTCSPSCTTETYSVTLTTGHSVVIFGTGGNISATDTLKNSYQLLFPFGSQNFGAWGAVVARCVTGGATTITVTPSVGAFFTASVIDISNLPCTGALVSQTRAQVSGTSTTPALTSAIVTQTPNEIVLAPVELATTATPTAGSGYTVQNSSGNAAYVEWQVFPTPLTSTTAPSSLSGSANWFEGAITLNSTQALGTALAPWPIGTVNQYHTGTNCLAAGSSAAASAVACGSAAAGMFSIPITTPTSAVVTTTALNPNSEIFVNQRLDTTNGAGAALSVTCNTTPNTTAPNVTARGTNTFTITFAAFSSNPGCYEYHIVN